RFSGAELVQQIGEWCARSDAIRNPSGRLPAVLVCGVKANRAATTGSQRLVGVGSSAAVRGPKVRLQAYLQDQDSGVVVAIEREIVEPVSGEHQPFWKLGQAAVIRGASLADVAEKQLIVQSGKRSASHVFDPGRQAAAVYAQAYRWEEL